MAKDSEKVKDQMRGLPKGVAAAGVANDGSVVYIMDPFLRGMKWEGVSVMSNTFTSLAPHERLYRMSNAYLASAIVLCERAGETGSELQWPQASVCYYCLHLATELFLKACILRVGREPATNHDVAGLYRKYRQLLPGKENSFQTKWSISAADINEWFGADVINGIDRSPDQLFRYGMDKKGTVSSAIHNFVPGYAFNYMKHLEQRWSEIWQRVNA